MAFLSTTISSCGLWSDSIDSITLGDWDRGPNFSWFQSPVSSILRYTGSEWGRSRNSFSQRIKRGVPRPCQGRWEARPGLHAKRSLTRPTSLTAAVLLWFIS